MRRKLVLGALVVAALAALVVGLSSCASADRAAAERARAEAALVRAETQADNASHERFIEVLTYVLIIGAGLLIAGGAGFVVWDIRTTRLQQQPTDPGLLLLLDRQDRRLAELERATWHTIAAGQRGALDAGREVVIYPAEGQR